VSACPECDGPLVKGGSFCRTCGWDGELAEDDHLDGIDLPGDFDYDEALRREGLADGGPPAAGPPLWLLALGFLAVVALLLLMAM
jgi:hypothetical protein